MIACISRIFRSLFSLPAWVIVWMLVFLIPANLAGLFMLDTQSGRWIALLGAGGLLVNLVPVFVNGGFSRVLAIPHLVFWLPLELVLLARDGSKLSAETERGATVAEGAHADASYVTEATNGVATMDASLSVRPLFLDGFESGDTTGWSAP